MRREFRRGSIGNRESRNANAGDGKRLESKGGGTGGAITKFGGAPLVEWVHRINFGQPAVFDQFVVNPHDRSARGDQRNVELGDDQLEHDPCCDVPGGLRHDVILRIANDGEFHDGNESLSGPQWLAGRAALSLSRAIEQLEQPSR